MAFKMYEHKFDFEKPGISFCDYIVLNVLYDTIPHESIKCYINIIILLRTIE